jgi:hypothetical protein
MLPFLFKFSPILFSSPLHITEEDEEQEKKEEEKEKEEECKKASVADCFLVEIRNE